MLYIVATPIGNLNDISFRAIEVLKNADFLIAENPGHSQKLLSHYQIGKKRVIQFAEHNEQKILGNLIDLLSDKNGCLISDAGTPCISDPGFRLVRACRENNIPISSIPGPNAAITGLSASGLPTDKFWFVGFLPKTTLKLKSLIENCTTINSTLVGYESPQRITKTISTLVEIAPNSKICIAKELTKMHENYLIGNPQEVLSQLSVTNSVKGEITIIISLK